MLSKINFDEVRFLCDVPYGKSLEFLSVLGNKYSLYFLKNIFIFLNTD